MEKIKLLFPAIISIIIGICVGYSLKNATYGFYTFILIFIVFAYLSSDSFKKDMARRRERINREREIQHQAYHEEVGRRKGARDYAIGEKDREYARKYPLGNGPRSIWNVETMFGTTGSRKKRKRR